MDYPSLPDPPVHVDAGAGLDIVEMDIAVLRDQVHHRVLLGDLHRKLQ